MCLGFRLSEPVITFYRYHSQYDASAKKSVPSSPEIPFYHHMVSSMVRFLFRVLTSLFPLVLDSGAYLPPPDSRSIRSIQMPNDTGLTNLTFYQRDLDCLDPTGVYP
jgi:hypothetical protein